jgi:hypothetical protein
MSYLYMSNQRHPVAYDVTERPNKRSFSNQFHGLQQDRYGPRPEYHNQHAHCPERRGIVGHDHTLHGQSSQAYYQMPSARPLDSQHGPHIDRHDFDHQQHYSNYSDDSEDSSTAALVGSRAPQSSFVPQQPYHDFHATPRAGDPYIQPVRSQLQHEPSMNHGRSYSWGTEPVPGPCNGLSHQHDSRTHHTTNPHVPFMPNPGSIPTHYNSSQAWFNPARSMNIPPPTMYAPASTFWPRDYSSIPTQPLGATTPHAAENHSHHQPPANDPPGGLSNNAIDQDHYSRLNNENIANPMPGPPRATRSPRRSRRRKGKGKGR